MLYVDPDVGEPKLVARILEKTASRVLRFGCVFDVATDIVEALADVREDTMREYRGVFINESLYRHPQNTGKAMQGKDLSRFFRQAGMSAARIILLVNCGSDFDIGNAEASGLNAVLRKPFTGNGFCELLHDIYSSEYSGITSHLGQEICFPSKMSMTYSCDDNQSYPTSLNKHQHTANGSESRVNSQLTAAAGTSEAIGSWTPDVIYPEELGFTQMPSSILNRFHTGSDLIQLGKRLTGREPGEGDEAAIPARMPDGQSRDSAVLPAATAGHAVDQAGEGSARDLQPAPAMGIEEEEWPSSTHVNGIDEPATMYSSCGGLWLKRREASNTG